MLKTLLVPWLAVALVVPAGCLKISFMPLALRCPLFSKITSYVNLQDEPSVSEVKRILLLTTTHVRLIAQFYSREYSFEEAAVLLRAFLPHREHHETFFSLEFLHHQPALLHLLLNNLDQWNRQSAPIWWSDIHSRSSHLSPSQVRTILAPLERHPNLLGSTITGQYAARLEPEKFWHLSTHPVSISDPIRKEGPQTLLRMLHNLYVCAGRRQELYVLHLEMLRSQHSRNPTHPFLDHLVKLIFHKVPWMESYEAVLQAMLQLLQVAVFRERGDLEDLEFRVSTEALWHGKLLLLAFHSRRMRAEGLLITRKDRELAGLLLLQYIQKYPPKWVPRAMWEVLSQMAFSAELHLSSLEVQGRGLHDKLTIIDALLPPNPGFWGSSWQYWRRWERYLAHKHVGITRWPRTIRSVDDFVAFWGDYALHAIPSVIPVTLDLPHPIKVMGRACTNLRYFLFQVTDLLFKKSEILGGPEVGRVNLVGIRGGNKQFWQAVGRLLVVNILHLGHPGVRLSRATMAQLFQLSPPKDPACSQVWEVLSSSGMFAFVPQRAWHFLPVIPSRTLDYLVSLLMILVTLLTLFSTTTS